MWAQTRSATRNRPGRLYARALTRANKREGERHCIDILKLTVGQFRSSFCLAQVGMMLQLKVPLVLLVLAFSGQTDGQPPPTAPPPPLHNAYAYVHPNPAPPNNYPSPNNQNPYYTYSTYQAPNQGQPNYVPPNYPPPNYPPPHVSSPYNSPPSFPINTDWFPIIGAIIGLFLLYLWKKVNLPT